MVEKREFVPQNNELFIEKSVALARYEIGWWKAHHRKDQTAFVENMCQLYSMQFGIDQDHAMQAVLLRKAAADWHDIAEEHEDRGDITQANIYWDKAEECLLQHFKLLEKQ